MRARAVVVAVLSVVAFASLAAPPSDAFAGGTVSAGKPLVVPPESGVVREGEAVTFRGSGRFKPSDEEEEGWVAFNWDFGDGSVVTGARHYGDGTQQDEVQHTYDVEGEYVVRMTAFHGYTFTGFKFAKTKTLRIKVFCAGTQTGPAKCPKARFAPFTGEWTTRQVFAGLSLTQNGGTLSGTGFYTDASFDTVNLAFKGPIRFKRINLGSGFGFSDQLLAVARGTDSKGRRFTLELSFELGSVSSYRQLRAKSTGLVPADATGQSALDPMPPGGFERKAASAESTSQLCASLKPGKKKVDAGEQVVFAIVLSNQGLGGVASKQIAAEIEIEGGTIVADRVASTRTTGVEVADRVVATFDSLGQGTASHAQGGLVVTVRAADAGSVECTVRFSVVDEAELNGLPDGAFYVSTLPQDLHVCVPIVPKPTLP